MKTPVSILVSIFVTALSALIIVFILSGFSIGQTNQVNAAPPTKQSFSETGTLPLYYSGMITIKVRKHVGELSRQKGNITLNNKELDYLADIYEVELLEKRFKYDPGKLQEGLPDLSRIYRLEYGSDADPVVVSEAFAANPAIEYAEPVPIDRVFVMPDDSLYDLQQHLPQVYAEEAWEIHKGEDGSEEVVIAIIDTGVDWEHEDLTANSWQNMGEDADGDGQTLEYNGSDWVLDPDDLNGIDDDGNGYEDDLIGWDFYEWTLSGSGSNPDPYPSNPVFDHGTHVAGISAAVTDNEKGIASISWNVKYMAVQCATNQNSVAWGYDGMIYAAQMGADIINNSWGGPFYSLASEEVIEYVTGLGSIVVCAAGNGYSNIISYPASYPGAVSVASVSKSDGKSLYSNFGPAVDVSAPGGDWEGGIFSTLPYGQYGLMSGTSMASPNTAALMALVKSYHPTWTSGEIIAQVIYSADNINPLNPGYEYLLGSGRINAYNALLMGPVSIPQEVEIGITGMNFIDNDGNKTLEPGDTVTCNFILRNFNQFVAAQDVSFTLSTNDTDLQVISEPIVSELGPDESITLFDTLRFVVSEDAVYHMAQISLEVSANLPVVTGEALSFDLAIAPEGIFVYDKSDKDRDFSGRYITDFLQQAGKQVTYQHKLPYSLNGFDAVFCCFGNIGINFDQGFYSDHDLQVIRYYLLDGGNAYIESGGFFSGMSYVYPAHYSFMANYFGVQNFTSTLPLNPMDGLDGLEGSIMEGMDFLTSHQLYNFSIESLTPNNFGEAAFYESGFGNVSSYRDGSNFNTFLFEYTLAELEDENKVSSRYKILSNILDLFGIGIQEDYILANFKANNRIGGPPLEVSFADLSLTSDGMEIDTWSWDLDGDGTADSSEENPIFTYDVPGHYDIMLAVSSGDQTDTLILEDYVQVNQGVLVFETHADARNFSGTFIYEFLVDNGIEARYTNTYPTSFLGYDAVFISQGVRGYMNSSTPDGIVTPTIDYLESGGQMYIEGDDVFGQDWFLLPEVQPYFGLDAAWFGVYNPLNNMTGLEGSIAEGMFFTESNQTVLGRQDIYTASESAQVAFTEDGIYPVAVQYSGDSHKTFCLSYPLAELEDNETTSREDLLTAILNYFGIFISGQNEIPVTDEILKIYPNPTSATSHLLYKVSQKGPVSIVAYTISGTRIKQLLNEVILPGRYKMVVSVSDLPAGIYYCVLKTQNQAHTIKLIKL